MSNLVGRRTREEVAMRAAALLIMGRRAHGRSKSDALGRWKSVKATAWLSQREKRSFSAKTMPQRDAVAHSWGVEAAYVLLWALGLERQKLRPLNRTIPLRPLKAFGQAEIGEVVQSSEPRTRAQLDRMLESVEHAHWRVRDGRLNGKRAPKGLNPDVIFERHRALAWLLGDETWDEVATDT